MRGLAPLVLSLLLIGCSDDGPPVAGNTGGAGGNRSASSTGTGSSQSNVLERAQLGDPQLSSAQRLAFGPGGVLLIGDGLSAQVVAIETGDTSPDLRVENGFGRIDNVTGAAADLIGNKVTAAELQIDDIAINPVSWRTYIAITRYSTFEAYVLWVDVDGNLRMFDLQNVVHAAIDVPPSEGNAAMIADVAWTPDHVIASVTPQSFVRHEMAYMATPFEHEALANQATTRIFHRSWGQWITEQPMDRFFTFERQGETFLVGSYTSTIVRFESTDLQEGASDVVGTTVFDILDGRSVLDFITYERDGEMFVLASIANFLFDGEAAAVRLDGELFYQPQSINDKAPIIFDFLGAPVVTGIQRATNFDAALKIARRDDDSAVVLRNNSLITEKLP